MSEKNPVEFKKSIQSVENFLTTLLTTLKMNFTLFLLSPELALEKIHTAHSSMKALA